MPNIKTLFEFITLAERNRKYPPNTAFGLASALKLFEQELNEEEKESLETFISRLPQIYQSVFNKNKLKMSTSTLETYRRRILKVVKDYEKYGQDPTKLQSWNPLSRTIAKKTSKKNEKNLQIIEGQISDEERPRSVSVSVNRHEINLKRIDSEDAKAIIIVPADLTLEEAEKIKKYIDAGIS